MRATSSTAPAAASMFAFIFFAFLVLFIRKRSSAKLSGTETGKRLDRVGSMAVLGHC
jgi:hypothetical protein